MFTSYEFIVVLAEFLSNWVARRNWVGQKPPESSPVGKTLNENTRDFSPIVYTFDGLPKYSMLGDKFCIQIRKKFCLHSFEEPYKQLELVSRWTSKHSKMER